MTHLGDAKIRIWNHSNLLHSANEFDGSPDVLSICRLEQLRDLLSSPSSVRQECREESWCDSLALAGARSPSP
jgi:hypothetical protein